MLAWAREEGEVGSVKARLPHVLGRDEIDRLEDTVDRAQPAPTITKRMLDALHLTFADVLTPETEEDNAA